MRIALPALLLVLTACDAAAPPNLLLITLDTTRADRLGPYGFAAARTPNLDAFATDAVVYEHAYATSSWTLPSHASIFTGLLPMQHGAQTAPEGDAETLGYSVRPLSERFLTLAERLRDAGYRTAAIVAGPALKRPLGVAQGFESYDDDLSSPGQILNGRRAAEVADAAIAQLEAFGDGPWFLFVNFYDPHAPYAPPGRAGRGLPEVKQGPLTLAYVGRLRAGDPWDPEAPVEAWERETLDGLLAGYDAEIAYMDTHLGRLLRAVDARAGRERTFVAITADHGESFGEHHYLSHGAHLYEDNVRVPLLLRWPGSTPGRVKDPVQNHRLFATLLDAADVPRPADASPLGHGAPIVTQVGASDANVRMFGEVLDRGFVSLLLPPHKLIRSTRGTLELYDLARDPAEAHDLASDDEARRRLDDALARVRRDHPSLFDPSARADLDPDTEAALRELGYID